MLSAIYHVLGITFFFAVYWPGVQPDATLEAELAAARAPVTGENGYRALPKYWPQERWPQDDVPLCPRETDDCLAWAREHLDAYRAVAVALQKRDETLETLLTYAYFRPPTTEDYATEKSPSFRLLVEAVSLNAYRFAAGETEAAQHGACRGALLGLCLVRSQGIFLGSIGGAGLVERNIALLAQMRAELPPETPWPALCDELQPLPQEALAPCPLMYSDWLEFRHIMRQDDTAIIADRQRDIAEKALYFILMRQAEAQYLVENTKYCAPAMLAAVRRDEVLQPTLDRWPRYCSPLNPLCRMGRPYSRFYQARLLNVNRYLRAFAALRNPAAPLSQGYRREDGKLYFLRHPRFNHEKETWQVVALPLPGSRINESSR